MLNKVNSVIENWFDYTRLIYNRKRLWNKRSCYRYYRVYNTFKQSGFWLGTIRELMAGLITINARVSLTTFVEFFVGEFCVRLVPRVVAFWAWFGFLLLYFLSELYDFKGLLKSTFTSLGCPRFNLLAEVPFLPLPPKLLWLPWLLWPILLWEGLYGGIGIGALPLFWIVAELLFLGIFTAVKRH